MNWRFKNSVMGTYEIENFNLVRNVSKTLYDNGIKWVDTSICYNNDYHLNSLLKDKRIKVISKIPPQMINEYEFMISNHLRCLGRDKIDIMLIHNPRSDSWKNLADKMSKDERFLSIGVSNFNIDQIIEYKDIIGEYPEYNEMEINPLYYDKDLIEFCHDKGIKLIAYAILGGKYNARRNISRFTLPYLLSFAGYNSEFVIIRSDLDERLFRMNRFLMSLENNKDICGGSILNIESKMDKSILPTEYKYPEYYTKLEFPTNSDQVMNFMTGNSGLKISTGFIVDKNDIDNMLDDMRLRDINLPNYEFISDYRVFFRYRSDEILHNKTGKWPKGYYPFPSVYYSSIPKTRLGFNTNKSEVSSIVSVILVDKNGNLSKVDDGKSKFIIESIVKEH